MALCFQKAEKIRKDTHKQVKRRESLLETIMIFMGCRSRRVSEQTSNIQLINQLESNNNYDLNYYQKISSRYGSQTMSCEYQENDETKCTLQMDQNLNSLVNQVITTTLDEQATTTNTTTGQTVTAVGQQVTTTNDQITTTASTMDADEQNSQKSTETIIKRYSSQLSNNTDDTEELFNHSWSQRFSINQASQISNYSNLSSTSSARSVNSVIEVADKNWMSCLIASLYNGNQVTPPSDEVSINVTHHEGNNLSFQITKQGTRKHYEFHVTLVRSGQGSDNTMFEFNRKHRDLEIKNFYDVYDDNVLYLCAIHKANH